MGGRRGLAVGLLGAAFAGLAGGGCKHFQPMPELEGGYDLGLRRGSAWMTIKVRPPYVIGPTASLELHKGTFTGLSVDGDLVRIEVDKDGALGRGPGRVDVDFNRAEDEFVIEGVWNSSRVHFRITSDSFRGSIHAANGYCQYVLDELQHDGALHGFSICSGLPEETRLEIPKAVQAWLTPGELAVVLLELLSGPPTTSLEEHY